MEIGCLMDEVSRPSLPRMQNDSRASLVFVEYTWYFYDMQVLPLSVSVKQSYTARTAGSPTTTLVHA